MFNIAVFASGSGSNFQAILDSTTQNGILSDATICGLITNKAEIKAIDRAHSAGIEAVVLNPSVYPTAREYEASLLSTLEIWNTDLIVLAGYLRKIPVSVIDRYPNRILNIHPSLLPRFGGKGFYGMKVHKAVKEAGDHETGCTIHIVTEEFDDGPILAQERITISLSDSAEEIAARVLTLEHDLYPRVIASHMKSLT
ncbi:MAG: phosphoribosylglycinamide formyltransferase [Bacteroidota bacterium]